MSPGLDPVAVSTRNQVIDRMVLLSANHALVAREHRSTPVCPHAVAFLYADPIRMPQPSGMVHTWYRVVAATRVVPDTPDVRELPSLLARLIRLARSRYAPRGFDPAAHMSVYRDAASGKARYIGLGVSTLDSSDVAWGHSRRPARDPDLRARAYALLADQTAILLDRGPSWQSRSDLGVHATRELNFAGDVAPRVWTRHPDVSSMPAAPEVWNLMNELHQLIYRQQPRPTL